MKLSLIFLIVFVFFNKLTLGFSEKELHKINKCKNKRVSFFKMKLLNLRKKFFDIKYLIIMNQIKKWLIIRNLNFDLCINKIVYLFDSIYLS